MKQSSNGVNSLEDEKYFYAPKKIENHWSCRGLDCLVIAYDLGHRCGYVKIPEDHFLYKVHYDHEKIENFIDIHGGITFSDEMQGLPLEGWWLGFDCAHYNDLLDFSIMCDGYKKIFQKYEEFSKKFLSEIGIDREELDKDKILWTTEMVASEVEKLANQIADYEGHH